MSRRRLISIEEYDVLVIHSRLLALDGGATGIRDLALLQSALARPRRLHAYGQNLDIVDDAAAYTAGIVGNHPFVDGNQRVGFVVGVLFLELNGYQIYRERRECGSGHYGIGGRRPSPRRVYRVVARRRLPDSTEELEIRRLLQTSRIAGSALV